MFNATFGSYDFAIFEVYNDLLPAKYFGHFFMISFLAINMILLLNMVVAMMSDTYAIMGETRKGIYNY